MAKDSRHRPPARGNGRPNEPINSESGDFESIDQGSGEDDLALPSANSCEDDDPESFDPPLPSDSFNPPIPSDTHPLPADGSRRSPASRRSRPGPPVSHAPALEPAFLYVDRGPGEGRNVPIPDGQMLIGRSSASGLKLSHPSVSREHASLERRGSRFFIQDSGSHNGTYINGRQLSGRVELFGGDEIAMGKAVLVLRYGQEQEKRRPTSAATRAPLTERKAFKLTVFGSAVTLGILSVLALAKLTPTEESKLAVAPPTATARQKPVSPRPDPKPKSAPVAPRTDPQPEPTPAGDRPAPVKAKGDLNLVQPGEVSAAKVFQDAKNQRGPGARLAGALDGNKAMKAQPKRTPPRGAKGPTSSADTSDAAEATMLYEAGDLEGAIKAARSAGNATLANKIANFKKEIGAAKASLAAKDGAGAIKHYTAALAVDDELSKGWGKLGGQIRVELAKLFEKAGAQAAEAGDAAKASLLFQRALRYDPENEKAQEGLAEVKSSAAAPASKPAPAKDARSAADQAFDQ